MNVKLTYLLLLLLMLSCKTAFAGDSNIWLDKLDKSLDRRDYFDHQRTDRIEQLRQGLAKARENGREYEQLYALFDEYRAYCYDSARYYASACLESAQASGDQDKVVKAKNAIAFSLISAGILSEAHALLQTIDRAHLKGDLLKDYYQQNCNLWRSMADYVREEPYYTKYITQSNAYLDSLKQLFPENSMEWWSFTGSHQMRNHQFHEALASFENVLQLCDSNLHQRAMTTAEMAWAYIYLDDEEKAISYFAQSAIADNETATREITALYHLSRLVYKQGDYDRASRYVHQALEDVNFYGTRLRKVEINDILPIIEQDRYVALMSQRNWLFAATGLAVALLLGILGSYWTIHRKNRKLTEARETIRQQLDELQVKNDQLSSVIHQLKEANKIKNEYIGRSFYTNAEYIAKLEKLYLALDRKIVACQYDDLRTTLKQSALNAERENMFESFDQTFLKLFPQFVAKYNELFEEKDRKEPANDHSLTSEMRIFALIRLGITDSDRIANFLDYSVHTVNTYKTRIKNRSKVDNDQFEQLIMEI